MRKNSIKNTRVNGAVLKELSTIIHSEITPQNSSDDFCDSRGGGTGS